MKKIITGTIFFIFICTGMTLIFNKNDNEMIITHNVVTNRAELNKIDTNMVKSTKSTINYLDCEITEVDESKLVVKVINNEDAKLDSLIVNPKGNLHKEMFNVGDKITCVYNGEILTSYPAQIHTDYVYRTPDDSENGKKAAELLDSILNSKAFNSKIYVVPDSITDKSMTVIGATTLGMGMNDNEFVLEKKTDDGWEDVKYKSSTIISNSLWSGLDPEDGNCVGVFTFNYDNYYNKLKKGIYRIKKVNDSGLILSNEFQVK